MAYLRHSFTLPSSLRKKKNKPNKIEFPPSLPGSPSLSRSETTLYVKTESDGRSTAFVPVNRIEDTLSKRRNIFPDFYGGHPLPEYTAQTDDHSDYGSDSMAHSEVESIMTDAGSTSVTLSSSSSTCDTSSEMDVKNDSSCRSENSLLENSGSNDWQLLNGLLSCQCCCTGLCTCSEPPLYRMKLPCCRTMEPLWETTPVEDNSVTYRPRKKTVNWYDRKQKHKSCPVLQVSNSLAFFVNESTLFVLLL